MDALLIRTNVGLMPADSASREWFSKLRLGAPVLAAVSEPRNPMFHRKFFALLHYAFEYWEQMAPEVHYKGDIIKPDFDRFRKDVTILAGRCYAVANIKGEVRWEAESISFARMSEEQFEKLYKAVIDVLLQKVFKDARWNETELRAMVEKITEFDT
jgi:hypothetical protein